MKLQMRCQKTKKIVHFILKISYYLHSNVNNLRFNKLACHLFFINI